MRVRAASVLAAVVLSLLLVGCECGQTASPGEAPESLTSGREAVEGPTEETGTEPPEALEEEIGFSIPGAAGAAVEGDHDRYRTALEAHRRGDYEESRRGFAALVQGSDATDITRFNLACALSRLERHDEAAEHLRTLFRRDLPRFGTKLRDDEDLAGLRDSETGRALERLVGELEGRWNEAIAEGMPASYYVRLGGGTRHGFWLRERNRFVPVVPPIRGRTFSVIDVAHRRVAAIDAGWEGEGSEETYVFRGIAWAPFTPPGGPVVRVGEPEQAPSDENPNAIDLSSPDRVRFYAYGRRSFDNLGREVDEEGPRDPPPRPHQRLPEGYSLRGNRLAVPSSEEPIELGAGHGVAKWHSFAVSDDGEHVYVASERELEAEAVAFEGYESPHRTRVDYVHVPSRAVRRIADIERGAYVLGFGGDAYLFDGRRARRFVGFDPDDEVELHEHLVPMPPG